MDVYNRNTMAMYRGRAAGSLAQRRMLEANLRALEKIRRERYYSLSAVNAANLLQQIRSLKQRLRR